MRSEAMQEAHLGRDINAEFALIGRLVEGLKDRGFGTASLGLVLGSGLKDFGKRIHDPLKISLTELPGLPSPKVAGHGCELLQGEVAGVNVHVLTGRVHLYEGWHPWQTARTVRALAMLGTQRWLLTNAAGGLRPQLGPRHAAGDHGSPQHERGLAAHRSRAPRLRPALPRDVGALEPAHRQRAR
jgi:hypothetical protein